MAAIAQFTEMITFAEFARLIHNPEDAAWRPYPWQERFAARCASPTEAAPPSWVVAPTGAGKTMAIDALVWALAMQADVPAAERTASTRIVWAIDRRILVDEVYEHACRVAQRLEEALERGPGEDPLHRMAVRLLRLAAAGEDVANLSRAEREVRELHPLAVSRWRGGLATAETLLSPFQPQITTSTVGQIGSRLLFRGYGVGRGSLPLTTGLATTDTTICLDEAHLAIPFRETADVIRKRRCVEEKLRVPNFHLVTLTATPPADYDRDDAVYLDGSDRRRLGRRWSGVKTLELREPNGQPEPELAAATEELVSAGRRVVACIVNRVLTARKVHGRISKALGGDAEVLLLMGPQRPVDRSAQIEKAKPVLLEGATPKQPLVVVATQTIEVGLDADFDGMVTQSASASALIQRLGRLNRSGSRPGRCIVIRDQDSPLYEEDEPAAWQWLEQSKDGPGSIDVSVRAIAEDTQVPANQRHPMAASMTDMIVRQLSQTSSRPASMADPDIDPLLTGIGSRQMGDVQIVWRCDLRFEDGYSQDDRLDAYRKALLKLARPQAFESLTLSAGAAKNFLRARIARDHVSATQVNDADVEGGGRVQDDPLVNGESPPFMVVRGGEVLPGSNLLGETEGEIALSEVRAGDTVVVPTWLGGVNEYGLDHSHKEPANDVFPDLGESIEGAPDTSAAMPIRLSWETFQARWATPAPDDDKARRERHYAEESWRGIARALEQRVDIDGVTLSTEKAIQLLDDCHQPAAIAGVKRRLELSPSDRMWRLRRVNAPPVESLDNEHSLREEHSQHEEQVLTYVWILLPVTSKREETDETSVRDAPPTVESHSKAVRARVSQYATWLNLPEPERCALELAALAHDLGKLDPRFQDFLAGGTRQAGSEPLAKSTFGTADPVTARLARIEAGLPSHFRHEARSAAILDEALTQGAVPTELAGADGPLAIFLAGCHHGWGHPSWPLDQHGRPPERFMADLLGVRGSAEGSNGDGWLDGRWLQLFFDLQEQFGSWTLAYLEALFVLADRTVSREGG